MLVPCLRCGQGAGWLHVQATLCCRSPKFLTTGTRKLDAPPSPRPIRLGVGEWGSCLSKDWYLKSSRRIYKHQTQTRWSLQMARRPPRGKGAQEGRSQNRSRRNGPWRYGGEGAGSSLAAFFSGIPAGPTRDRKYFPRSRRDAGCSPSVRWEWVPGGRGGGGRGASGEGRWRPGKPGSWGTRGKWVLRARRCWRWCWPEDREVGASAWAWGEPAGPWNGDGVLRTHTSGPGRPPESPRWSLPGACSKLLPLLTAAPGLWHLQIRLV